MMKETILDWYTPGEREPENGSDCLVVRAGYQSIELYRYYARPRKEFTKGDYPMMDLCNVEMWAYMPTTVDEVPSDDIDEYRDYIDALESVAEAAAMVLVDARVRPDGIDSHAAQLLVELQQAIDSLGKDSPIEKMREDLRRIKI